jgi:putative transposase
MSRPSRLDRFEYIGFHRYFLTFCTRSRSTIFIDAIIARDTLAQILRTASEEHFSVLAYCLMPDHVHLLVEGTTQRADLRRFAKMSKQRSGAIHALRSRERLWQEGYHDHILRKDEDLKSVARYILENPVRAGLVRAPTEYPYLGSEVWTLAELFDAYQ